MFGDEAVLIGHETGKQNPRSALQKAKTSLPSLRTAPQNDQAAL
jgi:hypothetical protein